MHRAKARRVSSPHASLRACGGHHPAHARILPCGRETVVPIAGQVGDRSYNTRTNDLLGGHVATRNASIVRRADPQFPTILWSWARDIRAQHDVPTKPSTDTRGDAV